jgi:nicotinamidase-related amidase
MDQFTINRQTAIVITDPQNDFMKENGAGWGIFGPSVIKNDTREHILQILNMAFENDMLVFISPHYYYKQDHSWGFGGRVEKLMHQINMFERTGPLTDKDFEGSGADWYETFKTYFEQSNVIITSPHKVYGAQSNDLCLQLRKRGIDKVILCGMAGNLCCESHLRDLLESGFETSVVFDATASASIPDEQIDGDAAALGNFKLLSSKVFYTKELLDLVAAGVVN